MNKYRKKLVKLKDPCFIHKRQGCTDFTFMVGEYALPWKEIIDMPLCSSGMRGIPRVARAFPKANIYWMTCDGKDPAIHFKVIGKTKRYPGDSPDWSVGDAVAKAKAAAMACTISKAIIKAVHEGLERELNGNYAVFDDWYKKNKNIVKKL